MQIALIRQYFDRHHGGAERYAVRLARGLLEQGHHLSIICVKANPEDAAGMQVIKVSKGKWAGPYRHQAFARHAGKAAQRLGSDVVIALARAYGADFFRLGDPLHQIWLRLRQQTPEAYQKALRHPRHRSLLKLEADLLSPTAHKRNFIVNSELVKRQVIHAYGVEPGRLHVLYNPVDKERFSPHCEGLGRKQREALGIAPDELVILFSGMEYRRKGLMPAARTFAALFQSSEDLGSKLRFVVVGKGDASPARELLARSGCADRMIIAPPSKEIECFYAAANVFLLPTLYDPSANAVGEALSCGTPVITTRLNGASEFIRPGVNGLVLSSREDAQAWARATAQILATERIQRSRSYVAMASQLPDLEHHLKAWQELFIERAREQEKNRFKHIRPTLRSTVKRVVQSHGLVLRNSVISAQELIAQLPFELDRVYDYPDPEALVKSHRGSQVARYSLSPSFLRDDQDPFEPSQPQALYLKISRDEPEAGPHEFEVCMRAAEAGVQTMQPLLAGSNGKDSFFLSAEAPGKRIDDFLAHYCQGTRPAACRLRAQVLSELARITVRFHKAGMNHRDLYAPHIWVSLNAQGQPEITLIDLKRVQIRDRVPLRWLVKDLAQIHFSLPSHFVSSSERLQMLRYYVWELGLEIDRRRLLRLIAKRIAKMKRHQPSVEQRRKLSDQGLAHYQEASLQTLRPATQSEIDG